MMDQSSNRSYAVENSTLRDGHHFRRPKPLKPKHFKNRILLERTSLNTTRTNLIDKNAKVPKLILKKINVNDMLSYMNAAKTTDPKFNDTIASQASESDDWHLCVSTTSEEDFQASPIHQNVNVCGNRRSARNISKPLIINDMMTP